jgi:hypothetical protein
VIDNLKLQQVIAENAYLNIQGAYGEVGREPFHNLLGAITNLYKFIDPQRFGDSLIIFERIEKGGEFLDISDSVVYDSPKSLLNGVESGLILQFLPAGIRVWKDNGVNIENLAKFGIVYKYSNCSEWFYAKDRIVKIPKLDNTFSSHFSIQTFLDLKEALDYYKSAMVRYSSCKILSAIWKEANRIFLKNKPEETMRDSLCQYLRCTLRGNCEVRPEQNVDETHPVDIKVTWLFSNRLALIEIKWLGDSVGNNGQVTVKYRDSRAIEGAQQLAAYLDMNSRGATNQITKGYLVVIDARRRGLSKIKKGISKEDGFHYADKEIEYDPQYDRIRDDFEIPIRMFAEPICSI